jgi:hypothetical protein
VSDTYLRTVMVNGTDYGCWEFCADPNCAVKRHRDGLPSRFWLSDTTIAVLREDGLERGWAYQQGYNPSRCPDEACWEGTLFVCRRLLAAADYTDPLKRKVCERVLAVGKTPWPWSKRTVPCVEYDLAYCPTKERAPMSTPAPCPVTLSQRLSQPHTRDYHTG